MNKVHITLNYNDGSTQALRYHCNIPYITLTWLAGVWVGLSFIYLFISFFLGGGRF